MAYDMRDEQRHVDEIVKVLRAHDTEEHQGDPCRDEYANAIAFLIHRLGMLCRPGLLLIIDRAEQYAAECGRGEHQHGGGNGEDPRS